MLKDFHARQGKWIPVLAGLPFFLWMIPNAAAQEPDWAFRFYGEVVPFSIGEAGSGGGEPDYDDAFGPVLGVGMELEYWLDPRWSLLAGAGVEHYHGDSFQGIDFGDWQLMPLYAGVKYRITPDEEPWAIYARLDVGAAYLSDVEVEFAGVDDIYWSDSWSFLGDIGVGFEYPVHTLHVFLEIRWRYVDKPEAVFGPFSEASELWSLPVLFGIRLNF